jgi:hypothetical protein
MLMLLLAFGCSNTGIHQTQPAIDIAPKTLHRLNRAEYNNTVQDLFYTDLRPARDFPIDDTVDGFDNVAAGLSMSPLLFEMYESAADTLLDDLFLEKEEYTEVITIAAEDGSVLKSGGILFNDSAWAFNEADTLTTTVSVLFGGSFQVTLMAFGEQAEGVYPSAEILVDNASVGLVEVSARPISPSQHTVQVTLDPGIHTVTVAFANPDETQERMLGIDKLRVEGPMDPRVGPSVGHDRILFCDISTGLTCITPVLNTFAERAWRRPLTEDEATWIQETYSESFARNSDALQALRATLKVIVLSPDFIYRVEPHSEQGRSLTDYEIASRISYFLWSSMPDETLRMAAERGDLQRTAGRNPQILRMLEDDKASALVSNFAGQWWGIRGIDDITPTAESYPDFDARLRSSMRQELENLAVDHLLLDRPMTELLLSSGTWLDERLAEHYRVAWTGGESWVYAPDVPNRGGLLTTAGWLAVNAHADRGSPVARGKWVMDNLLCTPIPPPPPDGGAAEEAEPSQGSVRMQDEAQRSLDYCQACHASMDPIGYALDAYDGIGMTRTEDELGYPVDTVTVLDNGRPIASSDDLQREVALDPRFVPCVVEKAWTYALGRPPTPQDAPHLGRIASDFKADHYAFSTLVFGIISSPPFLLEGSQ